MKNRIKTLIREIQWRIRDATINRSYRKRLHSKNFSLITSDCIGGVICKDLRVKMDSPTRNFYFMASDFIKFCSRLEYYMSLHIEEADPPRQAGVLVGALGDLKLYLVHYRSVEQANEEWDRRKQRIHWDHLFFMMNDRNGCTERELEQFDQLPFQNKVCFTHVPHPEYASCYYLPGSEADAYVKTTNMYIFPLGIRRYYDQFDFVGWINKGSKEQQ